MSLLAVTVGSDPSAVVDAVRAVGWYGVRVGQRLACSGSCAGALAGEPVYWVDGDCGDCGFRPFVEVSLYAQPGVVEQDVFVEVEPGDTLVFEDNPTACPVLFVASTRQWWWCPLVSSRAWRDLVVMASGCGCRSRRVEVATVAARELLRGGRA